MGRNAYVEVCYYPRESPNRNYRPELVAGRFRLLLNAGAGSPKDWYTSRESANDIARELADDLGIRAKLK